jgi:hypothetical protein
MECKESALREAIDKCAERKQFLHDQITIYENRLRRLHEDLRELVVEEAVYKTQLKHEFPHAIS